MKILLTALLYVVLAEPDGQHIRNTLNQMNERSQYVDMVHYIDGLEAEHGHLLFDSFLPSLYTYRGVAMYSLRFHEEAEQDFERNVHYHPTDVRGWINLGEIRSNLLKFDLSIEAYSRASMLGEHLATSRLLKALASACRYQDFERIAATVERYVKSCYFHGENCVNEGPVGTEFVQIPGYMRREMSRRSPESKGTKFPVELTASLWDKPALLDDPLKISATPSTDLRTTSVIYQKRLKVGVLSSDFGVHPVSSLIRGVLEFIDQEKIELFCFSVTRKISWWGHNITASVEHFISLANMDWGKAARIIASFGVEILIDLNGRTLNSGLGIMQHRPAVIQMSFLGLPLTTGADYIDFYIGDPIALPAEHSTHFTEKLLLIPPCYISTDYAQVLGGVLGLRSEKRWNRSELKADSDLSTVSILFGAFCSSDKLNPMIIQVWMNILSTYPDSKLLMVKNSSIRFAIPQLRNISAAFGVKFDRLTFFAHLPWNEHVHAKTSVDIVLDSTTKSGHTTGLDLVWAGVPMITTAGGEIMSARAGESILSALESNTGVVYSLKEYEDISIHFARDHRRLRIWRDNVERLRSTSTLFDTKRHTAALTRLLESTWEAVHIAERSLSMQDGLRRKQYNIYHMPERGPVKELEVDQVTSFSADDLERMARQQDELELALGAGRVATNANHRFIPSIDQGWLSRGGVGRGEVDGPDGHGNLPDFFNQESHRLVMCTLAEKKAILQEIHMQGESSAKNQTLSQKSGACDVQKGCNISSPGFDPRQYPLPKTLFSRSPLILNIGGVVKINSMVNVNINAQQPKDNIEVEEADIVRLQHDLVGFLDESVDGIYTSHSLEHASYGDEMLMNTLLEWHRVLKPGAILMLSVPDLETLSRMYLDESLSTQERWVVTQVIYGAQNNQYDYRKIGFDEDILSNILTQAGFCDIERVSSYNLIDDSSVMTYLGYNISLNMVAKKCSNGKMTSEARIVNGHKIPPLHDFKTMFSPYKYV